MKPHETLKTFCAATDVPTLTGMQTWGTNSHTFTITHTYTDGQQQYLSSEWIHFYKLKEQLGVLVPCQRRQVGYCIMPCMCVYANVHI